jgi:hypothetical protein
MLLRYFIHATVGWLLLKGVAYWVLDDTWLKIPSPPGWRRCQSGQDRAAPSCAMRPFFHWRLQGWEL